MLRKLMRFRLSGLLILTTAVACAAGWYAWAAHGHRQEVAALTKLAEQLGGSITHSYNPGPYDWCGTGRCGYATFEWHGPPGFVKSWMQAQDNNTFCRLKELSLYGGWGRDVNDGSIDHLLKFKSLKRLDIPGDGLTADGIDRLCNGLPGVTILVRYSPEVEQESNERSSASVSAESVDLFGRGDDDVAVATGDEDDPFSGDGENPFDF